MIIDSHIHLYPDDIALRAHQKLAKAGAINDFTVGSYQNLCKVMDEGGIDRVIVQNIATGPEDVADVNAFALSIKDKRIFSFATLHPFEDKCLGRIAQYKKQGFLGVKLHPYFQHFDIADERLLPVYAALERENLPLLIHAGRDFTYKDIVLAAPKDIYAIQKNFPLLTIIAAHMGGMLMREEAEDYIIGSPVYIDTSLSCKLLDPKDYERMIKNHGPERILFGSDFPWNDPKQEYRFLMSLGLSDALNEKILWRNASKLYGFVAEA